MLKNGEQWSERKDGGKMMMEKNIYKYLCYYYFIIDGGRQGGSAMQCQGLQVAKMMMMVKLMVLMMMMKMEIISLVGCEKEKGWESHPPSNLIFR